MKLPKYSGVEIYKKKTVAGREIILELLPRHAILSLKINEFYWGDINLAVPF
jgi:hypothetical protein